MVCTECGLVVADKLISDETEWRNFGDEDKRGKSDPNRVGAVENTLLGDPNLGTISRMLCPN